MSPTRTKRKPVFDPSALDDDLDDLWPPGPAAVVPNREPSAEPAVSVAPPPPPATDPPAPAQPSVTPKPPTDTAPAPSVPIPARPAKPANSTHSDQRRHVTTTAAPKLAQKRARPPEVLLSGEVYDELYRVQIAEKKVRRGLARTMGAIVMDAIEAHAERLATTWSSELFAVGEGQLFERRASTAVPRRRRHATAPRTVVLSGVTAANKERLDDLVHEWDAGTRAALVEQALRYEFGLIPT